MVDQDTGQVLDVAYGRHIDNAQAQRMLRGPAGGDIRGR